MPKNYEQYPLSKKLDLYLSLIPGENYTELVKSRHLFEEQVKWIDSWLNAADNKDTPISFVLMDYQDLLDGQDKYIKKMLEKVGVDSTLFDYSFIAEKPVEGQSHFRKGCPDEWKEVFTDEQKRIAWEMMTPKLKNYFEDSGI